MTRDSGKNTADLLKVFSFEQMRFRRIEVMADGVLYRGILIGADSSDIYIKGALRWLVLPLDKITSVKLEGQKEGFDDHKMIAPGFYREPPDDDA
jgi:hypothetical protein